MALQSSTATAFRPNPNFLRTRRTHKRGNDNGHVCFCANAFSWSNTSNYIRLEDTGSFLYRSLPTSNIARKRAGVLKCATIDEIEAEKSLIEKDAKDRMEKTIESVRMNFSTLRTGRSNPSMLDRVEVEYYGTPVSLKSIAQISTPDASSILVQPYDKSSLKIIEKGIVSSDLGLTPNNDGDVIRLSIPQLTSERRKEKKLSEDNVKDLSSDLQKMTDEYMRKTESIQKQKEKELLSV